MLAQATALAVVAVVAVSMAITPFLLLAHERTGIADVNRSKRELERVKRIAKAEGVWDDARFRDQIALLEVDIVALEMMVKRDRDDEELDEITKRKLRAMYDTYVPERFR